MSKYTLYFAHTKIICRWNNQEACSWHKVQSPGCCDHTCIIAQDWFPILLSLYAVCKNCDSSQNYVNGQTVWDYGKSQDRMRITDLHLEILCIGCVLLRSYSLMNQLVCKSDSPKPADTILVHRLREVYERNYATYFMSWIQLLRWALSWAHQMISTKFCS